MIGGTLGSVKMRLRQGYWPLVVISLLVLSGMVPPTISSGPPATKVGLCCENCNATQYSPFSNASSWAYRYSLFIDDPSAAMWLADNRVEFVPHLAHHHVPLPNNAACNFDHAEAAIPLCTAAMLDGAVVYAKKQAATVTHLMGWNEAYDRGNKKAKKKYIAPADAATWWRLHVQGMAARANLSLVSPTTGVEKNKLEWLGDMLLACWSQRDQGCEVETLAAFSVHDYKCSEAYWRANYGEGGAFQTGLAAYLAHGIASMDGMNSNYNWTAYVSSRPIWVTETNCNGDTGWPPTAAVTGPEQCARITGQRADAPCGNYGKCGVGSIAAMESMPTIARVSWWNTWQDNAGGDVKTANAMLVDATGTLFPPGRAVANMLAPATDCTMG